MNYLMGIDLGTSGVKTVIVDLTGNIISSSIKELTLSTPKIGWSEQNPNDWWKATQESIKQALTCIDSKKIISISLSGQMHGAVIIDKYYKVLRPAILWNDTRTFKECIEIEEKMGGKKNLISSTYNKALEGFTLPKLLWIKKNEPDVYNKIYKIMLPKDFIKFKLTGKINTDYSDAAGTLMLNVKEKVWSNQIINTFDINKNILPDLLESTEICGYINTECSELTNLISGTPVCTGGADNACGALGSGITKENEGLISIGSSGVYLVATDTPFITNDGAVHVFNHSIKNKWYSMGVMLSSGLSLKWFKENLCQNEIQISKQNNSDVYSILSNYSKKVKAGCNGLIYLPYLNGERTPYADSNARGLFFGITPSHKKEHFVRAIMEGVAYSLKDTQEIFKSKNIQVKSIKLIGGGAKSTVWSQIIADTLNKKIIKINKDEGPAFGAAILAGIGIKVFESAEIACKKMIKINSEVFPNNENSKIYNDYYKLYKNLYSHLKNDYFDLYTINKKYEK